MKTQILPEDKTAGAGYRFLEKGEKITAGDEYFSPDLMQWCRYGAHYFVSPDKTVGGFDWDNDVHRRKITTVADAVSKAVQVFHTFLPEPYAKLAVKALDADLLTEDAFISAKNLADYMGDAAPNNLYEMLCEAFNWSESSEGNSFWLKVSRWANPSWTDDTELPQRPVTKTEAPKSPDTAQPTVDRTFNKEWWFEFQQQAFNDMVELTRKKNQDYTGGSEAVNPFANFDEAADFGVDPLVGLSVRMGDKMQRLKAYCSTGKLALESDGDTVADIFRDFIGYSALALGMLERRSKS